MIDMRLVKLGIGEPRAALVEQGRVSAELALQYETKLAGSGWPKIKTEAMNELVVTLETAMAIQAETRSASKAGTRDEYEAIGEAKAFIRKLRNALPMTLRDSGITELQQSDFQAGGKLGRSTANIIAYLIKIRPAIIKLQTHLMPYFGGASVVDVLDACKSALESADSIQEVQLTGIPEKTLAIYEAKGRLLQMVNDLIRVGHIAFDGQAEIIGRFNKDILLRGRRMRKSSEKPDTPKPSDGVGGSN